MNSAAASPCSPAAQVKPRAVLIVVALAQFMVILDASVVNVALPTSDRSMPNAVVLTEYGPPAVLAWADVQMGSFPSRPRQSLTTVQPDRAQVPR